MSNYYNRQWRLPNSWNGTESNVNKQSNYSLSFDGSSQYISTGFTISSTSSYTLSAWFKTTTTTQDRIILGDFNSSAQNASARAILGFNGTRIYLNMGDGTNQDNNYGSGYNASSYFDGNWHLYTLTINGFTQKAYLDGTLVETWTSSVSAGTAGERGYTIGRYGDFTSTNYFNGQIDAVSIFNYELSSSQVSTLYGSSSTGIGNPMAITGGGKPVAYYPLGDQDSFNGSNYLVPNSSLKDYVFDFGTFTSNDRIVINDTFDTIITGTNFTISSWINLDSLNPQNLKFIFTNETLQFTITNKITTYLRGASGYFLSPFDSNTTLSIGKWYNVVLVKNGSDYTYYLNGSSDGTVNNSTSVVNSSETTSLIGDYYGTGTLGFDGRISNTQIFNTALPATGSNSIETLYNNGSPLTSMSGFTSLQGWWKLDASATYDSSTTTWTIPDDSSNSNDGTSSGMTQANLVQSDLSFTSGYSPYALDFDGANDSIEIDSIGSTISTMTQISVSAWVKTSSSSFGYILYAGRGGSGRTGYVALGIRNSPAGTVYAVVGGQPSFSGFSELITTATVNDDNWHHLVMTFNNSNGVIQVYIDGSLDPTSSSTSGLIPTNIIYADIGQRAYNNDFNFDGSISNISIWNAALTSSQVTEIYSEGIPQNLLNHSAVSSLVSWWQLGSNSSFNTNWTVLDEKGTNNGESVNMTESDIVDGVGSYANGLSSGMGGDEVVGDAPYSSSNSLSVNMDIADRTTDTPS